MAEQTAENRVHNQPDDEKIEALKSVESRQPFLPVTISGKHNYAGYPSEEWNITQQGSYARREIVEKIAFWASLNGLALTALSAENVRSPNLISALATIGHGA